MAGQWKPVEQALAKVGPNMASEVARDFRGGFLGRQLATVDAAAEPVALPLSQVHLLLRLL